LIPEHTNVTARPAPNLPDRHSPECQAVNGVLARVGDKWSVLIIVLLGDGTRRFNEIKKLVGGISQRMLTLTLRGLERDGLVTRTIFPTIPPRVDYELTDLGRSLWQAVEPLGLWARSHVGDIHAAQAKFDKAEPLKPAGQAAPARRQNPATPTRPTLR
jgi:DNA-binding HxlR family transcriptional regulator